MRRTATMGARANIEHCRIIESLIVDAFRNSTYLIRVRWLRAGTEVPSIYGSIHNLRAF